MGFRITITSGPGFSSTFNNFVKRGKRKKEMASSGAGGRGREGSAKAIVADQISQAVQSTSNVVHLMQQSSPAHVLSLSLRLSLFLVSFSSPILLLLDSECDGFDSMRVFCCYFWWIFGTVMLLWRACALSFQSSMYSLDSFQEFSLNWDAALEGCIIQFIITLIHILLKVL